MLRPGLDLVTPQRERPLLAAQTRVDPTCIAHLLPRLAAPPDRRLPRQTVAALRPRVLLVGDLRRVVVIDVRVDELLWAQLVALLQVEPASVAEWSLRRGFAAPQRCGGNMTVETFFFRRALVGMAAAGSRRGRGSVGYRRGCSEEVRWRGGC
jgi:hypothetical protein